MELIPDYKLPTINYCLTKTQVAELADMAVVGLLDEGDVLKVAETLASMEAFIEAVRKDERYSNYLLEELAKHNGKLQTATGAKIEACETAVKYDYSQTGAWNELNAGIKKLSDLKKELEDQLKKIPAGKLLVDETTGETLVGPSKSSKTSYKITLAK